MKRFGRRDQLTAFAQHVFFSDQAFYRGRARGGRAKAFFLHGFTQFIVVYGFAGAFHRAQQSRFRIARWGPRLQSFCIDGVNRHPFTRPDRHQRLAVFFVGVFVFGFLAINRQPARLDQHFAFGFEAVASGLRNPRRDHVFGTREKHRHEAAHHQVIQLLLGFA